MTFILLVAVIFSLVMGYALKAPCLDNDWGPPGYIQYRTVCYSDLQALYGERNLDERKFPYVVETSYEYPVLTGLEMWLASNFARTHKQFFIANLPFLGLSALLALVGLIGAVGPRPRVLWYALGSPLIFYAFHNWDLLAVAPLALGMWAWARRRDGWAAFLLGIGAAAKLFPGYAVPTLLVARWREPEKGSRDQKQSALWILGGAAAGYGIVNLPVIVADVIAHGSPSGWLAVFKFHAKRTPDFGTYWYWLSDRFTGQGMSAGVRLIPVIFVLGLTLIFTWFTTFASERGIAKRIDSIGVAAVGGALSLILAWLMLDKSITAGPAAAPYKAVIDPLTFGLFAMGCAGLLTFQWRRRRDPWSISAAIVTLFLLTSKVHSPQYTIWLVAFFVVVNVPWWLILPYLAADAVLLYSGFYWFATSPQLARNSWQDIFVISVYWRTAALLALMWWFTLAGRDLIRGPGAVIEVNEGRIEEPPVAEVVSSSGQALDGEEKFNELAPSRGTAL